MMMVMDKDEFIATGQRLYGEYGWKARLSRELDMHRHTITKYAAGTLNVPKTVELAIRHLEAEK